MVYNIFLITSMTIKSSHQLVEEASASIQTLSADEVFAKLEKDGIDPVLFGLTDKDFEMLAKNFAKIRNQLMQTNELLDQYKEYYEETEDDDKE